MLQKKSKNEDEISEDKAQYISKHLDTGEGFFQKRDLTNALIEYEDVVKTDPKSFKAHYMLGKVLLGMSDYEEALKEFDTLVILRPTSGDAHFMKGDALRLLGRYDAAEDEYTNSLKIDHKNALAHAYLAECYRKKGSIQTSDRRVPQGTSHRPQISDTTSNFGSVLCSR